MGFFVDGVKEGVDVFVFGFLILPQEFGFKLGWPSGSKKSFDQLPLHKKS